MVGDGERADFFCCSARFRAICSFRDSFGLLGSGSGSGVGALRCVAEGFFAKEVKFAKRWLTTKGVMVQEEQRNPVDTELESFFNSCKTGQKPRADIEVGMADAVAVILSNMAMDEGRKVYFSEIDKMGLGEAKKS